MSENCLLRKSVPLSSFTQSYLGDGEFSDNESITDATFGGILSNNKYSWYANGPRFQVVDTRRGKTIAGWCFGSIVKDSSTKVVCVTEIPTLSRDTPVLVVGLEYLSTGGTICIFDVLTSKVLRALQLREKISSLHVIDGGNNLLPLQGPLRSFDGVIGVGCVGGDVLLIDLCRHSIEEEEHHDEVDTCQIVELTCKDLPNLEYHKQRLQTGFHLAINLNESYTHINRRKCGPDVSISSLCYCPQLASLIVGYNFGAWQIWELLGMNCVYTSPTYDKNVPISHFAIQEPSDDPKPICYIWAVYSHKETSSICPLAVLYSLNYGIKEFHDGYGVLYQDFESCMVRYQIELGFTSQNKKCQETNFLRLTSHKSNRSKLNFLETQEDFLSVCYMAWNVHDGHIIESYVGLFDLNQWYKAQMPPDNDDDYENYLSIVCLTDLIGNNEFLLDVAIDEGSFKQFLGVQKPEEHYFPTALSYEICCSEEKSIHFIYHQGQHRTLLNNIEESDSLIFLKPQEICKTAQKLGLTPLFFDSFITSAPGKFLLSLALEHQMIGWLCKCVNTWSNGRFKSSGFTLEFFLDWAWNRAVDLKANVDILSTPLFDYSETVIDANNQRIMNACINQLRNLVVIYEYILNNLEEYILYKDTIHQQYNSLQMVVVHLEVIQWLVNTGLLPESEKSFLYPMETLLSYYDTRRLEIQNAHYKRFSSKESLLFIDILLKHEFYDMSLQEYWKEDDGNGLYPPPSMQSLLRTYLIDNISLDSKHLIIIYAFLDLAMALDRDNARHTFIITQLIKFPTIFRLNPSIIAVSQAFWHLDHGDFGPALDLLLDPAISNTDLKLWHHRTVINALLIQNQYNLALTYYEIRKPPLKEEDDIIKLLSLFVKNNMIYEALEFQRKFVNANNQDRILTHFYKECHSTRQLKKLLYYALNEREEKIIMKYLRDISHPEQEELEVTYYIQRFRYMDVFQMSKEQSVPAPSGLQGQKAMSYKESFAKKLTGFFPKVSNDLFQACQNQRNILRNKVISRPHPMSVVVHKTEEQAKYKSSLIQLSMIKARETWNKPINFETNDVENVPFMRTPLQLSSSSRKRPLICPKIIKVNEDLDEESGESPSKKQKLQARQSLSSLSLKKSFNDSSLNLSNLNMTKIHTPVIKRKVKRLSGQSFDGNSANVCTPQSILKVRNLINSHSTHLEDNSPNTSKTRTSTVGFGLTPRKSTSKLSVHFENSQNDSTSDFMNLSPIPVEKEEMVVEVCESSENKDTSDEVFYSPESSLEENNRKNSSEDKSVELERKSTSPVQEKSVSTSIKTQIKGRGSYKDKSPEMKNEEVISTTTRKSKSNTSTEVPVLPSPIRYKSRDRKSLSRMVLLNNALSTLSPNVRKSTRRSLNSPKSTNTSILSEKDSSDGNKIEESSLSLRNKEPENVSVMLSSSHSGKLEESSASIEIKESKNTLVMLSSSNSSRMEESSSSIEIKESKNTSGILSDLSSPRSPYSPRQRLQRRRSLNSTANKSLSITDSFVNSTKYVEIFSWDSSTASQTDEEISQRVDEKEEVKNKNEIIKSQNEENVNQNEENLGQNEKNQDSRNEEIPEDTNQDFQERENEEEFYDAQNKETEIESADQLIEERDVNVQSPYLKLQPRKLIREININENDYQRVSLEGSKEDNIKKDVQTEKEKSREDVTEDNDDNEAKNFQTEEVQSEIVTPHSSYNTRQSLESRKSWNITTPRLSVDSFLNSTIYKQIFSSDSSMESEEGVLDENEKSYKIDEENQEISKETEEEGNQLNEIEEESEEVKETVQENDESEEMEDSNEKDQNDDNQCDQNEDIQEQQNNDTQEQQNNDIQEEQNEETHEQNEENQEKQNEETEKELIDELDAENIDSSHISIIQSCESSKDVNDESGEISKQDDGQMMTFEISDDNMKKEDTLNTEENVNDENKNAKSEDVESQNVQEIKQPSNLNDSSESEYTDKTMNKAFFQSTNVIVISDSSDGELEELNNAMIDSQQFESDSASNKSTDGSSSSRDSLDLSAGYVAGNESNCNEGEEIKEDLYEEIVESGEVIEEVEQVEVKEINEESGGVKVQEQEEEIELEEVKEVGIQVTMVMEEGNIEYNDWEMEEGFKIESHQEPFLTYFVSDENEIKLEEDQSVNVEEIKKEDFSSDNVEIENVMEENVEIKLEEVKESTSQVQDLEQKQILEDVLNNENQKVVEEENIEVVNQLNSSTQLLEKQENQLVQLPDLLECKKVDQKSQLQQEMVVDVQQKASSVPEIEKDSTQILENQDKLEIQESSQEKSLNQNVEQQIDILPDILESENINKQKSQKQEENLDMKPEASKTSEMKKDSNQVFEKQEELKSSVSSQEKSQDSNTEEQKSNSQTEKISQSSPKHPENQESSQEKVSRNSNIPETKAKTRLFTEEDPSTSQNLDISTQEKLPRVVLCDIMKKLSPEVRNSLRGLSIDRVIPQTEPERPKTPSRRLRSMSVDTDTPVRKSRRLAALGAQEQEVVQSPSRTRRNSLKSEPERSATPKKNETKPVRRTKRSKSDCEADDEVAKVTVSARRVTRSNSTSSALPPISESESSTSRTPSLRSGLRSSRSRSKTPDFTESSSKTTRKGTLEEIPEEPEVSTAEEEPKRKRGRPRKGSTK